MGETITNYGEGTNVTCKGCRQRKIFVSGPTKLTIHDGRRYLRLECPSPSCNQIHTYEEDELELCGSTQRG